MNAAFSEAEELDVVFFQREAAILQPGAAGRGEGLGVVRERCAAIVIVVSRRALNRRLDLADEPKSLRCETAFLDEIARETDKIRRKLVDRADDLAGKFRVALVMKIAEMNKAAWTRAAIKLGHAQRRGFQRRGVRAQCRRQGEGAHSKEFAAGDVAHELLLTA